MAFYRMGENNVGRGIESDAEKASMGVSLEFCASALNFSREAFQKLFSDVAVFNQVRFDLSLLK